MIRNATGTYMNDASKLDMEKEPTVIPEETIIIGSYKTIDNPNKYDDKSIFIKTSGTFNLNKAPSKINEDSILNQKNRKLSAIDKTFINDWLLLKKRQYT